MQRHKKFGILALVFMLLTDFSGICKPIRKAHGCLGCLAVLSMIGAVVSGHALIRKGSADGADEAAQNA
ncbi:MAG: hypothetical protein ACOYBD_09100 [Bilifractor sp.]|jgi:hypothetical protein